MAEPLVVLIATPLLPELVEQIRAVDPRIKLLYDPELLPRPRFPNDHGGSPGTFRTPEQEARFLEMLGQAEVLFDFDRPHLRDLSTVAPRVRWVQSTSAGIGQMVKRVGLDKAGIVITTSSGVHARPLADFCLMAMLMFSKDYLRMEREKKAKHWERYCGEELTGKTLAIVGLGRVGQEVARHGKKMDMRVVGMRRSNTPVAGVDKMFDRDQLRDVLAETDFLVLVAPHTPETEGMIGADEIAAMKRGAVLINIGRAQLVDEPALIRALNEGHLAGAALDVFNPEPPPDDSPFWDMPNVIISPHSASTVTQENARITEIFCDNLQRYLSGRSLRNVLDIEKLY
jgi:phosphoglycerate dehydrogenase-like enzyme